MEAPNECRHMSPSKENDAKVFVSSRVPTRFPDSTQLPHPHATATASRAIESSPIPTAPTLSAHPRARRHAPRQAACGAHYSLSAKWSSFTEYLTESKTSSESEDDADEHTPNNRKRRFRRAEGTNSDEESESDEYMNSYSGGQRPGRKGQRRGENGKGKLRRKIRRLEKLDKADLEVINGEKPKVRKMGVHGRRGKLGDMTRAEAGRMIEYLLGKTNWEEAAAYIRGGLIKVENVNVDYTNTDVPETIRGSKMPALKRTQTIGPDGLRTHWKDTLSKRLVELYAD
ncbi:hypothetical protein MMC13_002657 [Lambiella insularis]|nr:hypothetical protein [Lambiella insularis]